MTEEWHVYGYAPLTVTSDGQVTTRVSLHTKWRTEEEAVVFLTGKIIQYGKVVAILAYLRDGMDLNGYRTVVRRINEGRAWWE